MPVLLPTSTESGRTAEQRQKATTVAHSGSQTRPLRSSSLAMEQDTAFQAYEADGDQRIRDKRRLLFKKLFMWGGIVLGGMAVLVACVYFPWAPMFAYFFETVEALGVWGNVLMVVAFIVISFPFTFGYIPLSLGCGYLYGVVWGTMTAGVGANSGALLCFITVRVMLRPFCLSKMQAIPQASMFLGDGTRESGISFSTATLWRFAPIPFGFSNSLFALSSIPMGRFVMSTVIGLMPFQVMWVYLGTTLRSLTDAANGNIEGSTAQYVSLFVQLFIGLLAPLYMAYKAYTKKPQEDTVGNSTIEMDELGRGAAALDQEELGIPLDTFQRSSAVRLTVGADLVEAPAGADFV